MNGNDLDYSNVKINPLDYSGEEKRWILETKNNKYVISNKIGTLIKDLLETSEKEKYFNSLSVNYQMLVIKLLTSNEKKRDEKKSGMWVKLTLINQNCLKKLGRLSFMFNRKVGIFMIMLSVAMFVYSLTFSGSIEYMNTSIESLSGISYILAILIIVLGALFHELGHITASTLYGTPPKALGIGIYFISPVIYVDVDDSWKLKRTQRVVVDIGGVYFESIYATILLVMFIWIKNPIFAIIYFIFMISIVFNLNPFLKYDGYWFFSDLLGVYNLNIKFPIVIRAFLKFIIGKKDDFKKLQETWKNKVLLSISIYGMISIVFYVFFSYKILKYIFFSISGLIASFNIINFAITIFFIFLGFKSIIALMQLILRIFVVKTKNL